MDRIELVRDFWNLLSQQKWEEAKSRLSSELIVEWPQSRERMRGPGPFIDVNQFYPGNHRIEVLRAHSSGDQIITTVWITADTGQKTFAHSYFEFQGDKISRIEEYWSEPYDAPGWRKRWVELY